MNYTWATSGPWIENKETDTEYKYEVDGNTLYIAFKGSTGREDWKQNFSFWIRPYKNMPVKWFAHAGFVRKWKSIEDDILSIIEKEQPDNVYIYGFSQGGAIAVLAHEAVIFNYPLLDGLTLTWGAPRVVWAWNYNKIYDRFYGVIRLEKTWDIVPKLPPWIFGYKHVGVGIKMGHLIRSDMFNFKKNHMSYGG